MKRKGLFLLNQQTAMTYLNSLDALERMYFVLRNYITVISSKWLYLLTNSL